MHALPVVNSLLFTADSSAEVGTTALLQLRTPRKSKSFLKHQKPKALLKPPPQGGNQRPWSSKPFATQGGCDIPNSLWCLPAKCTSNLWRRPSHSTQTPCKQHFSQCWPLNLSPSTNLTALLRAGRFGLRWPGAKLPLNCNDSCSWWTCCYHPLQLRGNRAAWFCHLQVSTKRPCGGGRFEGSACLRPFAAAKQCPSSDSTGKNNEV